MNCAGAERHKEATAVFEAKAELVQGPTQSVLAKGTDADGDDDMIPAGHVARSPRNRLGVVMGRHKVKRQRMRRNRSNWQVSPQSTKVSEEANA